MQECGVQNNTIQDMYSDFECQVGLKVKFIHTLTLNSGVFCN